MCFLESFLPYFIVSSNLFFFEVVLFSQFISIMAWYFGNKEQSLRNSWKFLGLRIFLTGVFVAVWMLIQILSIYFLSFFFLKTVCDLEKHRNLLKLPLSAIFDQKKKGGVFSANYFLTTSLRKNKFSALRGPKKNKGVSLKNGTFSELGWWPKL